MPDTPMQFKRLVVLHNPKSSRAAHAEVVIERLKQAYPGKVTHETIGRSATANRLLLCKALRPGDILVTTGGDGTISSLVNCLLDPKVPAELRRTPVLALGTGRMNDVARMLNGKHLSDPLYILEHGKAVPIYPLDCVCTPLQGGQETKQLAIYSIGFGYTAAVSQSVNSPDFRESQKSQPNKLMRETELYKATMRALHDVPLFSVVLHSKKQTLLDITICSGQVIGGYFRMPVRLSSKEFFVTTIKNKKMFKTVQTATELISRSLTSSYKDGKILKELDFVLNEPVPAHIGGEEFLPPTPCTVHIALHKSPVMMIATNPDV